MLCHTNTSPQNAETYFCSCCGLVFKNPTLHLSSEEDLKRYSTHQNNEHDQGYLDFLNRLAIPLEEFVPKLKEPFSALDFGCGPGPTLVLLLKKMGGQVENYDPLFFPNIELLERQYDVVTSTEVVEHFKNPKADWEQLVDRVKTGGVLAIMTQFYHSEIDYKTWWYKNDPTHIVFYQEKTLDYLAEVLGLSILYNDKKSVIIFRKK